MAHLARDRRGLLGDVGEVLRRGTLVDRRVGHEHGVRLADHDVNAERRPSLGRIEHAADLAHRLGIGARDAG